MTCVVCAPFGEKGRDRKAALQRWPGQQPQQEAQRVFNNAWNLSQVEEDCLFICLFCFVFRDEDCCPLNCMSVILL